MLRQLVISCLFICAAVMASHQKDDFFATDAELEDEEYLPKSLHLITPIQLEHLRVLVSKYKSGRKFTNTVVICWAALRALIRLTPSSETEYYKPLRHYLVSSVKLHLTYSQVREKKELQALLTGLPKSVGKLSQIAGQAVSSLSVKLNKNRKLIHTTLDVDFLTSLMGKVGEELLVDMIAENPDY